MMLSDVCLSVCCLSVAYIRPKSRTERPRKTKIGTEVARVTRDSDTTFKVKRLNVKVSGGRGILWYLPHSLFVVLSLMFKRNASCYVTLCLIDLGSNE